MKITVVDFVRETKHTLEGDPRVIEHWVREQYPEDFLLIPEGDLYSLLYRLSSKYGVGVALLEGQLVPIPGLHPEPALLPEDPNSEELAPLPDPNVPIK